jgi:hypothetical protein
MCHANNDDDTLFISRFTELQTPPEHNHWRDRYLSLLSEIPIMESRTIGPYGNVQSYSSDPQSNPE